MGLIRVRLLGGSGFPLGYDALFQHKSCLVVSHKVLIHQNSDVGLRRPDVACRVSGYASSNSSRWITSARRSVLVGETANQNRIESAVSVRGSGSCAKTSATALGDTS